MVRSANGRNALQVSSTLCLEGSLDSMDSDNSSRKNKIKDALTDLQNLTPQTFRNTKPSIIYKAPQDTDSTPIYIKRIMARNSSLLLAGEQLSVVMNLRNISKNMDTKLNKQFHYFRREFLESATSVGATVPLDILEDGSGKLITFIKFNGPKNVLEILSMSFHQEAQSVHLQRCGLSLLIVTIAILHRRLTQMETSPPPLWSVAMIENVSTWAADALHRIADGGAVGVCVSLLMNSYLQGIQELALNLLSHLVTVSEEAAMQMLQPPGNYDRNQLQTDETETNVSVPKLKKVTSNNEIGSNDNNEENKITLIKHTEPICVSYILSVATQQRNRYVIMAAVAEVMIAITFTRSTEICETVASAPTCYLRAVHDEDSKPDKKGYGNQNNKKEENLSRSSIEVKKNNNNNNINSGIVEWAGLKILIKFLMRFVKSHSHLIERSSSTDKSQSKRLSKSNNILEANIPIRVNTNIPSQLEFVHLKVVTAATCLIISSPIVASYAVSLPGAVQAIRISAAFHPKSENTINSINKCLQCLNEADQNNKLKMKLLRGSPVRPLTTPNGNRLPSLNETTNQDNMNPPLFSNKINNIDKFSPQNSPNRPFTAPIESFSPTKRTSSNRPLSRQEEIRAPSIPYDMPEYPLRRGLPVHQQGQDSSKSLHTSFFGSLPSKPFMPIRISQEDVKEHLPQLEDNYDPEASRIIFESIANKEIWKLKREGHMVNGKHSVSIIERARRVYLLDPVVVKPNPELEIIYPSIENFKIRTPSLIPSDSSEISKNKKNNFVTDGTKIRGMELDITGELDDDVPDIGHERFSKYDFEINTNISSSSQEKFDEDYDNTEINDKFKDIAKDEIKDKINFGENDDDDDDDEKPIKSANFEANLFDALDILFP